MKQLKWTSIVVLFLILSLSNGQTILASPTSTELPEESQAVETFNVNDIPIDDLKQFWDSVYDQYGGFLPESQKGSFVDFISGEKKFSLKEWLSGILQFIFHEIIANGKLLGTLILLTVFSVFLQSLQSTFEKTSVSKVANAIVFMVLMIIALNSFYVAVDYVIDTIAAITDFLIALIPLLLALIASSGGVLSSAFFHPMLLFLMNTSGALIEYVVLPLLFLSTLLSIVSLLSEHYKVTQLAGLLRTWSIGLLGIFMTVFLGVVSVQGVSTAVADGIGIRTAKFVTGNFIPVVGRMFTDAADTVIGASLLLKNTVGIAGVVILLIMTAFPALKILLIAMVYKVAAAILQPLGAGQMIKCLEIISKNIIFVFAALAIVSLMFFLTVTVIVAAGNITMMVR
jgi:stage III sporulation protein AE